MTYIRICIHIFMYAYVYIYTFVNCPLMYRCIPAAIEEKTSLVWCLELDTLLPANFPSRRSQLLGLRTRQSHSLGCSVTPRKKGKYVLGFGVI